jgi:hypothetical protein
MPKGAMDLLPEQENCGLPEEAVQDYPKRQYSDCHKRKD